jgi:hypothetical protein
MGKWGEVVFSAPASTTPAVAERIGRREEANLFAAAELAPALDTAPPYSTTACAAALPTQRKTTALNPTSTLPQLDATSPRVLGLARPSEYARLPGNEIIKDSSE